MQEENVGSDADTMRDRRTADTSCSDKTHLDRGRERRQQAVYRTLCTDVRICSASSSGGMRDQTTQDALCAAWSSIPQQKGGAEVLIQISKITVGPDRPPADPAHVRKLTTSLGAVGILSSITISDDFRLIAGLHRLEAAKALGWTEIECVIQPLHGLEAELAELDEDVVRKDISGVTFGEKLLRRKEVYETLYPETRAGTAQANGMNRALGRRVKDDLPPDVREGTWVDRMSATSQSDKSGCEVEEGSVDKMSATLKTASPVMLEAPIDKMTGKVKSFVEDTAEKMNVTPRTVRRQLQAARNLNADAGNIIKAANVKISKKGTMLLSRLEPEQQKEAAEMLAAGEVRTVEEYEKKQAHIQREPPPLDGEPCSRGPCQQERWKSPGWRNGKRCGRQTPGEAHANRQ